MKRWLFTILSALALLLFSAVVLFLVDSPRAWGQRDIEFVLPVGFRGEIRLELDPQGGVSPRRQGSSLVYEVPTNGVMRLKSFRDFERWHGVSARYADGQAIPVAEHVDGPTDAAAIYFHDLGQHEGTSFVRRTIIHFVGTFADADRSRRKLDNAE